MQPLFVHLHLFLYLFKQMSISHSILRLPTSLPGALKIADYAVATDRDEFGNDVQLHQILHRPGTTACS
jgi:hypothetical protein